MHSIKHLCLSLSPSLAHAVAVGFSSLSSMCLSSCNVSHCPNRCFHRVSSFLLLHGHVVNRRLFTADRQARYTSLVQLHFSCVSVCQLGCSIERVCRLQLGCCFGDHHSRGVGTTYPAALRRACVKTCAPPCLSVTPSLANNIENFGALPP